MRPRILLALSIQKPHYSWQLSGEGRHSILNHNRLTISAGAGVYYPQNSNGGCIHTYRRPGRCNTDSTRDTPKCDFWCDRAPLSPSPSH